MTLKRQRKEEVVEEERLWREEREEEREIEAEKVDDDLKDKQGDGDEKAEDAEGHMNDNDETATPEKELIPGNLRHTMEPSRQGKKGQISCVINHTY